MSFEDVLDKVSNGEPIVVCGKVYEPKQIYRFPHLHSFDGLLKGAYLLKLEEEINEAKDAFYRSRVKGIDKLDDETVIELFDVIQVAETTLRNSGRTEDELLALMERHNAKDAARGYDKPMEGE